MKTRLVKLLEPIQLEGATRGSIHKETTEAERLRNEAARRLDKAVARMKGGKYLVPVRGS
jgi:hypothetical protein